MSEKEKKAPTSKNSEMPAFVRDGVPAYDTSRWKRQGEYTLDDYYALPDDEPAELIDGVIYDMGAPLFVHQDLVGMIFMQLESQLRRGGGPCKAYFSPVDITWEKTGKRLSSRMCSFYVTGTKSADGELKERRISF